MHVIHLIAVEADDIEGAISAMDGALAPYGDGQVWDWYTVGGRWNNYFGDQESPDEDNPINVINYAERPEQFEEAVKRAIDSRNASFREYAGHLTGARVYAADLPDYELGIRLSDKDDVAARMNARREVSKSEFEMILESDEIPDTDSPDWRSLVPYYLYKVGQLTSEMYNFDSYFFDGADFTTKTCYLKTRCERSPDTQWLVAVDLHN